MKTVTLKRKNKKRGGIIIADELIIGALGPEYYVPVLTKTMTRLELLPLSYLLENYSWPKDENQTVCTRIYYFISGNRKSLIEKFEFHKATKK